MSLKGPGAPEYTTVSATEVDSVRLPSGTAYQAFADYLDIMELVEEVFVAVTTAAMMRRAMEYARGFDLPIIDHCEDKSLARGGVMHEGHWSLVLGLRGAPATAEEVDALRDCALAELSDARVHLAHLSTRGAIEAVRRAKERNLSVTCEVAPHHWTLTDEAVAGERGSSLTMREGAIPYDTNTKMSPPLRSRDHVEAILEGLRATVVVSDRIDETTGYADQVLGIATHFECEGTFVNRKGRIQRFEPAVAAPGRAVAGWRAFAELHAALGGPRHDTLESVLAALLRRLTTREGLGSQWLGAFGRDVES